jgi:hypothetical protein
MTPDDFLPLDQPQGYIYVNGLRYAALGSQFYAIVPALLDSDHAVLDAAYAEAWEPTDADRRLLHSLRISPE